VLFAAILLCCSSVRAGVVGSKHDFTGLSQLGIALNGPCSACHRAHFAGDQKVLWSRDLTSEGAYFEQTADPDYIPSFSILCYDCHINASAASPTPDDDPSGWSAGKEPQDVAFTDGPPEDGGADVGYYEMQDGTIPALGNPAPTDGSPTGGHYWKSEPSGTPDYGRGDKLPCNICHDPHDRASGGNEVMFLVATGDGAGGSIPLGDNRRASGNTREGTGTGRDMCAACHSYSDSSGPGVPNDPVVMWGVTLPKPPAGIADHASGGTAPCTDCHGHNAVAVSCTGCHGSSADNTIWPDETLTARTSYPDREGRHARHLEELVTRLNETPASGGGWADLPRTLQTISVGEQKRLCEYCHDDPAGAGGTGHYPLNYTYSDSPADVGAFNPLWDTAFPPDLVDSGASYAPATYDLSNNYTGGGTCASIDCHNNKETQAISFGWYDTVAGTCTICHTAGGAGVDPQSGLHDLNDASYGTVSHDGSFGSGYSCVNCHQDGPTDAHIDGAADTPATALFAWNVTSMNLSLNLPGDSTDNTCTSSCHSDGGDWRRLWSLAADGDHALLTPGQAYCSVCHGEPGGFRAGVEHVAASPHECDTCHFITSDPQHRDGAIDINDNLDAGCSDPTDVQVGDAPAGVYCAGCHSNDGDHTSPRTDGTYWPQDIRSFAGLCIKGGHPSAACLDCHNSAQGSFRLITDAAFTAGDFALASHHIDSALATTQAQRERGCIACHYESEAGGNDGLIGLKHYHGAGAKTDPETAQLYDVVNFDPADRAGTLSSVTLFCMGCHSQYMEASQPFAAAASGDTTTPNARAWDGVSIATKFDVSSVGQFSPYDSNTYNVTPAAYVEKADSPHRRPDLNERGVATDGSWSDTGGGSLGLQCLDCHNAHGSAVTVTRSWKISGTGAAADGTTGGILTGQSGRWGGWDYTPAPSGSPGEYSAEADLCFDCHLGDDVAVDAASYGDYGVTAAITDYYSGSSGRWRGADSWDTRSFTYKKPNAGGAGIQSSHWTGSLATPAAFSVIDGSGAGQCTPCHDPHGVTPRSDTPFLRTTKGGLKYPLLKGNWLTSPYKEDRAGDITTSGSGLTRNWTGPGGTAPPPTPRETPDFRSGDDAVHFNNPPLVGGGYGTGIAGAGTYGVGNTNGHDGFFIDDNTWGVNSSNGNPYWDETRNALTVDYPASGPLSGTYADFGGLCSVCHESTDSGGSGWPTAGSGRSSIRSIHSTVKGWEGNSSWNPFDPNGYTGFDGLLDQHLMDGGRMPESPGDPSQAPHGTNSKDWPSTASHSKIESAGSQHTQVVNGVSPKATNNFGRYNWAVHFPDDDTETAPSPGYHRFSCSKCHSPHSQALPRLMRSNCMETSNNGEEGRQFRDYKQGVNAPHTNTMACHGEDYHLPWNQVTPWDNAPPSAASPMPTGGKQWETY
jgi:hypothetical protein